MKEQDNEVFNVELQSTRPDGYRRGGFSLNRGINRLQNVPRTAVDQMQRDASILIRRVIPVELDSPQADDLSINLQIPPGTENAGAQSLAGTGVTLDADTLNANAENMVNLLKDGEEKPLAERLAALISQLTPEQYTQAGVPDAKALSALAGEPVSAADRDAAFELYKQQQQPNANEGE